MRLVSEHLWKCTVSVMHVWIYESWCICTHMSVCAAGIRLKVQTLKTTCLITGWGQNLDFRDVNLHNGEVIELKECYSKFRLHVSLGKMRKEKLHVMVRIKESYTEKDIQRQWTGDLLGIVKSHIRTPVKQLQHSFPVKHLRMIPADTHTSKNMWGIWSQFFKSHNPNVIKMVFACNNLCECVRNEFRIIVDVFITLQCTDFGGCHRGLSQHRKWNDHCFYLLQAEDNMAYCKYSKPIIQLLTPLLVLKVLVNCSIHHLVTTVHTMARTPFTHT